MRKITFFMHAAAVLALSACSVARPAAPSDAPPQLSALEVAAAQLTPERIDMAVRAIDLAAVAAKLAADQRLIVPGSPTAKTIARLLDVTRDSVNTARRLRAAGDLIGAARALTQAEMTAGEAQGALLRLAKQ